MTSDARLADPAADPDEGASEMFNRRWAWLSQPLSNPARPLLGANPSRVLGRVIRLIRALNGERPLNCLESSPARCPKSGRCRLGCTEFLDRSPGRPSTARREMRPSRIAPILQPDVHGSCDDAHSDETPKTDEPEKNVVVGCEVGHRCDVCILGCLRCPNCSRCASLGLPGLRDWCTPRSSPVTPRQSHARHYCIAA